MMKLQKYFNHIAFDHAPELINQYFLDSDLKLFKLYVHSIKWNTFVMQKDHKIWHIHIKK